MMENSMKFPSVQFSLVAQSCPTLCEVSLKNKKIELPSNNSASGYITRGIESKALNRYLCTHRDSSIMHNSQKVETALMSISIWMNKIWYYWILFILKKEWNSGTCCNMDKPWKYYAKWNKPVSKSKYSMIPLTSIT